MVKKKQDNKNNVDETIIEMGPVIKKEPYTKLNILVIIFGISSLPITVLILLWFNFYKIPSFLKKTSSEKNIEILDTVITNEKKIASQLNDLRTLISKYQKELDVVNNRIKSLEKNNLNTNLQDIIKKFEKLEIQTKSFEKKIKILEKSSLIKTNPVNAFNKVLDLNTSNSNIIINTKNEKIKKQLLNEFHEIKKLLFNKKIYDHSLNGETQTTYKYVTNFLAGFFNLRDYRDNLNPRSILTKAEKSAYEGNIHELIDHLNKLPNDWKIKILPFIEKCKIFLIKEDS